jgi:hypothetical protein
MAAARSAVVLLGTSESSGTTIADTATSTMAEKDLLGDDISAGYANFFASKVSGTGTDASGLVISIVPIRITAGNFFDEQLPAANILTYTTVSGAEHIFLGTFLVGRYAAVKVVNNTGATLDISVFAEVIKLS